MADSLDSQAAAFAHLLELSGDPDAAFRSALALAEGLFPHQIEGVAFLLGRRRAILADDMGLGKTRQAIVSLRHLAPGGPRLVVCPASVKRNWAREIDIVAPGSSILVIEGSAPVSPTAEWVIVNYDIIGRHLDALMSVPWAALVFDEAHYLKNHTSARSKLARQLTIGAPPPPRATAGQAPVPKATRQGLVVQLLTGTPLTSRPRDLFVLLQLVGHPLGRSFLSFARRYCAAEKGEYGWKTGGASNIEELTVQLHGVMLRRSKDDVLSLPPKLRTWLPVEIPAGTGARAVRKVFEILAGKHERPATARALDLRRRGKLLAFIVEARQALAFAKVSATLDFVRGAMEQGEKVIVFSCFDDPVQKLARELGAAAVLLTGKTPSGMRQQLVDRFQHDDEVRVFVANIIAGGTGVNLTAATQVVFNDLDWVPTNHWQAEDRAYRIGQTRTVNVTYFVARNTIDDFVEAVLETKAALVNAIVEGEALAAGYGGDVLDELQHVLHSISARATVPGSIEDDEVITRLLRQASLDFRETHQKAAGRPVPAARSERERQALTRALEGLVKVLSGPSARRFRIASTSHQGLEYEVVAIDADVTCTCPGFEYRGQCRHARDVKAALAAGDPVPAQYAEVR
jgi:SWI/SNF-related matrix-associated actin-dependent regulator 1 of chromatin subfamily A